MRMNPEKVLTIAIPAYNASKFLPKCLQSLVDSNELERMEVLVIDDGSKESQDEVVRPYIDRFPQSIQMIHKENGGHGSVINKAVEIATGKYLKILDADDWVVSKNMKSLLDSLERLNADVVITHFDMVDAEERFRQPFATENVEFGKIYTMDDLAQLPKSVYACSTFHGIFYRLAFYQSTQIRMSENNP